MAERSDMADDPWKLLAKTNVLKDAPVPNARLEVVEGKVKWQPKKDYVHKSCGNLRVTNPVRKLTIKIVEHPFFEVHRRPAGDILQNPTLYRNEAEHGVGLLLPLCAGSGAHHHHDKLHHPCSL